MINLFIAILIGSFNMNEENELKFPNGFPEIFKHYMLEEEKIKDRSKNLFFILSEEKENYFKKRKDI